MKLLARDRDDRLSLEWERRFSRGYLRYDGWSYLSIGERFGTRRMYLSLDFGFIEVERHRPCRCVVGTVGLRAFGKRLTLRFGDHDLEREQYGQREAVGGI